MYQIHTPLHTYIHGTTDLDGDRYPLYPESNTQRHEHTHTDRQTEKGNTVLSSYTKRV